MKSRFTFLVHVAMILLVSVYCSPAIAQTGVLNPNDTIVIYNPSAPPATPPANTLVKWVITKSMSWNTSSLKAYFYNGLQFRLKWPKSYATGAPAGKKYPFYVFFHGVGERGSIYDDEYQMFHGGQIHSNAVDDSLFDGFLMYPQSSSPSGGWSAAQLQTVETLIENYFIPQLAVDPNRVIVSGLSGGGDAAWLFLTTYPTVGAAGWIMSSACICDEPYANSLRFTPIWMFTGGLDNNPAPYTSTQLYNIYHTAGADINSTIFTTQGHDTWDSAWVEPWYWSYINTASKTNPWTLGGRNQFCPGTNINVTMGVTAGFSGYQWRRNGVVIPGASADTLVVDSLGIYDCSVENGTTWSPFSLHPDTISIMPTTVSPNITVNGLASDVLPAPNGATTVSLTVPSGYTSYAWRRVDSAATLSSTTNVLTGAVPGVYEVMVTQQYGCSSNWSNPFTVLKASGANPPSVISGLSATSLSQTQIRLNWTESTSQSYPETQFEIYQATAIGGPYQLVGFSPALKDSFFVTGLNANMTYYFEVRPINATAAATVSSPASSKTQADIIPPTAPGNLQAGTVSETSVQLIWNSSTDNVSVSSYDIYVNNQKAYTIPAPDTTYTVYNLTNGNTYNFIVRAKDPSGNVSPSSNQLTVTAAFSGLSYTYYALASSPSVLPNFSTLVPSSSGNMPVPTVANAPQTTNFAYLWSGYINIPVTGNYVFQTNSDDGSRVWLGALNQTAFPYNYSGGSTLIVNANQPQGPTNTNSATKTLQAGVYPISIGYFQAGGGYTMSLNWSTPSTGGSFVAIPSSAFVQTVTSTSNPPAAPTNLTATVNSSKKVTLNWQAGDATAQGYQLFRATNAAGPFVAIGTTTSSTLTFDDSTLSPATTYYYEVDAINQYGPSGYNVVPGGKLTYNYYVTPGGLSVLPNFSTLTPTSTGTDTTFAINFPNAGTDWAATYTGYILIPTAGAYTFYTSSDDGSALYIDGNKVVNNDGLHGTVTVSGTLNLNPGAHMIQVQYFQNGGGQNLSASIAGPGLATEIIPASMLGLPPINVTTLAAPAIPAAPSGLTSYVVTSNKVGLTWIVNDTNAIKYEVWRSPVSDANYALDTTLTGRYSSYADSNLKAFSVYYYKVRAVNEGGSSAFCSEIADTTLANPMSIVTMASIPTQNLYNDTTATITLAATSNLGTILTYTANNLPAFATLTSNGNNTATLTMSPSPTQLGTYSQVTVTATDNFGGTKTDTFAIVVGGMNQDVTLLNINAQYPQAAPWNNMNAYPVAGTIVGPFLDINGNNTGISVTNIYTWSAQTTGISTGNNSGAVPDNVYKTFYYGSTAAGYQLKLTGLSQSQKYSLIFYAGYAWTPAQVASYGSLITYYTVNGQTASLNVANNTSQYAQLSGLSPDSTGSLLITINKPTGSAYEIIGAMQIISYTVPAVAGTLTPPSGLSAVGISTSKIQLNWTGSGDTRTGYEVWRSTSPVGTYSRISTPAANATSYVDSGLAQNSTYFYQVREVVAGPLYSAYSSYAGGSTVAYQVNISFNGSATYREINPAWNDLDTVTFNGYVLQNLTNTLGQGSGMNLNINKTFTGYDANVGETTGHNTGVVPDTVMETVVYNTIGDTAKFSISGLSRLGVYNFIFFGGTSYNLTTNTVYKIGNQSGSLNALNNTTQTVNLNNIQADTTGTVNILFYSTVNYGFLDAMMIQGMTSPASIAQDSTGGGSGGINTYLATTAGEMAGNAAISANLDSVATPIMGVYPNPFISQVTVGTTFKENVPTLSLVLIDMNGRILQENEYSNVYAGPWTQNLVINSSVPPGVYKLELIGVTGESPRVFTLVKLK
jgi:predicted esterase